MNFLANLAPAGSVTDLYISKHTPLTSAVATAISDVSPKLKCLRVTYGSDFLKENDPRPPPPTPGDVDHATASARLLLQLVGPRLTNLTLMPDGRHWPARALDSLSCCTALTKLRLRCKWPEGGPEDGLANELALLLTLSKLTSLRDMELIGGARPSRNASERLGRAPIIGACLSSLTALTRLEMGLDSLQHFPRISAYGVDSDEKCLEDQLHELESAGMVAEAAQLCAAAAAEWRSLMLAVRCMPELRVLRTPALAAAADLAALTTLTYLRVGSISLPPPPALCKLPQQLQRLDTYAPLTPDLVATLRPTSRADESKPGRRLELRAGGSQAGLDDAPWCLTFTEEDVDEDGRLTIHAASAMRRAVEALQRFDYVPPYSIRPGQLGMYITAATAKSFAVQPPPPQPGPGADDEAGGGGSHCASWLGDLAVLHPDLLKLHGLALPSRDLLALSRCMAGIQILDLRGCSYSVSSLPLLVGMRKLEELQMHYDDWSWPEVLDGGYSEHEKDIIGAAFLGLLAPVGAARSADEGNERAGAATHVMLPLPRLKLVNVHCGAVPTAEFLEGALSDVRGELPRRGPNPPSLNIGPSDADDDTDAD